VFDRLDRGEVESVYPHYDHVATQVAIGPGGRQRPIVTQEQEVKRFRNSV